jgi:tight adherence protein B
VSDKRVKNLFDWEIVMLAQVIAISATFAAVSSVLMAVIMLIRDLLYPQPEAEKQRLSLFPVEPTTSFDKSFFRLVEESGSELDMSTWLLMMVAGAILGAGLPVVLADSLIGAAGGMIVGCCLPLAYLNMKRFFRLRSMRMHLPEALQIVSDTVRAGQTLQESCELVQRDTRGPLSHEFGQAASQLALGHSGISVMQRMARRVPLQEFGVFATAVVVHRRAGGNLALLTERMAKASRERQDVTNHLLAVTSGSRLSAIGMVVGSMIAMGLLAWMEPDYVSAFTNTAKGPWLLALAVGLQLVGCVWVWRVLRVTY